MSIIPTNLKAMAKHCKITDFFCDKPTCTKSYDVCTTIGSFDGEYNWSVKMQCSVCNSVWWLCSSCYLKKKITNLSILRRHQYAYHSKVKQNTTNKTKRYREADDENPFNDVYSNNLASIDNISGDNNDIIPISSVVNFTNNENEMTTDFDTSERTENDNNNVYIDVGQTNNENSNEVNNRAAVIPHINGNNVYDNDKNNKVIQIMIDNIKSNMIDVLLSRQQIHFVNDVMSQYYSFDIISSGKKFLIAQMMNRVDMGAEQFFTSLTNDEVNCQIQISDFVRCLTRNQQIKFGNVIDSITRVYSENIVKPICTLPRNYSDIRRLYLDGNDAISKHLPIPNIKLLKNHAYVSVLDCVADFLLTNQHPLRLIDDYITSISTMPQSLNIFYSNRVKEIVMECDVRRRQYVDINNHPNVVLFLKLWGDDFDPNSSIKSNRQSVWVKTLTIFTMTTDDNKVSYTYPIAASKKSNDHEEIECILNDEIQQLRSGLMKVYFCRYLSAVVNVHADIFCIMTDQPERRSTLGLSAGNSKYHKRFGLLLDYNNCIDIIRCCKKCEEIIDLKYNIKVTTPGYDESHCTLDRCQYCSCWLLFTDHKDLSYVPDKAYPLSKLNRLGKINPKFINKETMEAVVEDIYVALERKIWTNNTCKSYLRTEGFNQKCIDEIMDNSLNNIAYECAKKNQTTNPSEWEAIQKDYEKNPRKYNKYCLPSSWYYMSDTSLYVDVPMHLLLLGVCKSSFIKIAKWMKIKLQSTEFKTLSVGILDQLKLYNIEWCKVLTYPYSSSDKFGGWVAENYLAFARIAPWFYSLLYELKESKHNPDLETPITSWRMKEHKFWLEIRGLSSEGKAKEIKARVTSYMKSDNPPAIIQNDVIGIDDILDLVRSLHVMISWLLSVKTQLNDVGYIGIVIRKFLNDYNKVDLGMGKEELPSWLTQYNFLCLLNVPNIIKKYGYLRNIWEGGNEGEGFLRKYKGEMKNGLKPKWQVWTIKNLLQRNVFQKENLERKKTWKENIAYECRVYQSVATMKNIIRNFKPITCVIDDINKILYILFREKKIIHGVPININWDTYDILNGCKYYEISFVDTITTIDADTGSKFVGCILLPRISTKINNNNTYSIIYSDWRLV
jgi:hypothetical protein